MEIKKYPDPILREKTEKVEKITPAIKKIAEDMIETMLSSEPKGVGLAAPQVGISKKMFVAQTEQGPRLYINPKIIKKGRETEITEEGCLSLPGLWLKIRRPKWVKFQYLDNKGKITQIKAEGLFARILQHETDHLNGILISDKKNFWQKIKRTLKK